LDAVAGKDMTFMHNFGGRSFLYDRDVGFRDLQTTMCVDVKEFSVTQDKVQFY
jgi:hypothetical protein